MLSLMIPCKQKHQRWKKRDHRAFEKTIFNFGAPAPPVDEGERDWTYFREQAKLEGKDDATLSAYYKYVCVCVQYDVEKLRGFACARSNVSATQVPAERAQSPYFPVTVVSR